MSMPGHHPIPPELHGFEAPEYAAVHDMLEEWCLDTSLLMPVDPAFIKQFLIELSPQLQMMIFNIISGGQEICQDIGLARPGSCERISPVGHAFAMSS